MDGSFDDFTHLSTDKSMTSSFTKSLYNQVIFHDLSDIYPTDSDIKCSYSLTDNVKPQAGDKIAIFKVGWASVSDYISFVRAQVPENAETSVLQVVFKAGTFEKKDNELYQLCYVTSGNVVAGASTPFSFHKPHESEFVAIEDPNDPGLVVFRSRVAQLQNDLEKSNEEKKSLETRYALLEDRYRIIREQFDKCETELNDSKEKISVLQQKEEELLAEKTINEEKKALETRCELLEQKYHVLKEEFDKCEKELNNSKELITELQQKQEELLAEKTELKKSLITSNEMFSTLKLEKNLLEFSKDDFKKKYDDEMKNYKELEAKFDQLKTEKADADMCCRELHQILEKLNMSLGESKTEISSLNELILVLEHDKKTLEEQLMKEVEKSFSDSSKHENVVTLDVFQEKQNELEIQKMKVESLIQEKERLASELRCHQISNDNLIMETRTLEFKLKELSVKHNKSIAEVHALGEEVSGSKLQIQKLNEENDELREVLNHNSEFGGKFLRCKDEKQMYQAQLENLQLHHSKCEIKKQIQLNELKMNYERELDVAQKEIAILKSKLAEFENQQQGASNSHNRNFTQFKDPASQIFEVITDACSHVQNVFESKLSSKTKAHNSQQTFTADTEDIEKLRGKLKILLNQKAELSECLVQEKHKCSELDRVMTEIREENAALKSRIGVLEFELATSTASISSALGNSQAMSSASLSYPIESLSKNIVEFTKLIDEQKILEQKLLDEKNAKIFLQTKIEFLLQEDAKMSNKLQEISEKYDSLLKEKEELSKSLGAENIELLQKLLEDNDVTINDLKIKLDVALKEKERCTKTINDLRNEMVGKITVENLAEYKQKMTNLKKELQKKKDDCFYMARFIQDRFRDPTHNLISCPLCPSEFPSSARESFVQHFDNHMS